VKVRKFVDTVAIQVAGGRGGNGCLSFRREKYVAKGGPDGGDGGHGGNLIFRADPNTDSLISLFFNPLQRAEDGMHGKGKKMHGRNGQDLIVNVPCGTVIRELKSDLALGDLTEPGQELLVARGGKGGMGNPHWQTTTHQTPYEHSDGEAGEEKSVRLDLKIIADVGLVGLPNAGKSSLLGAISNAHPRVAPYAFTTLNPIIGTVQTDDYLPGYTVADIPGLVKDAHKGVGLGDRFLRHVERSTCLVMVIDMAGTEGRDPLEDYEILREELRLYRSDLMDRKFIIVANKMDLPEAADHLAHFRKKTGLKPIPVSTVSGVGVGTFKKRLLRIVRQET
jgi:GTP-binding protein